MFSDRILITEKISWKDLILKYILRDTFLGLLDLFPGAIGVALRLFFYKFFLQKCGKGLTIKNYVTFKFPERIKLGDHVGVGEYSLLDGDGGLEIGNYVRIASHVSMITFEHEFSDLDKPIKLQGKIKKPVIIEDDCWLGTGVRVLGGVKIGKGSIIGAGSVVTKDIEPYSIAVGVPANVIRKRI